EMESARDNEAWNFAGTQRPKPPHPGFWSQALYIGMLGCAQDLHALLREISVESRERQTRTVNRGLANFPVKAHARPVQFHQQLLGMRIIKALDRNHRDALLLIACRCNRLGPALLRHEDLTSNVNHAQFPIAITHFGPTMEAVRLCVMPSRGECASLTAKEAGGDPS